MTQPPSPAPSPARRTPRVLFVLPALTAIVLATGVLGACRDDAGGGRPDVAGSSAPAGDTLTHPMEIRTGPNGVLTATLLATMKTLPVPVSASADSQELLRTYQVLEVNGVSYADSNKYGFPGPTFRVRQGDSVHITLVNGLPNDTATGCQNYPASQPSNGNPPTDSMEDCFHGPNSTNIHFHGFHVSPNSPADNVLLTIPPGDTFQYAFRIPPTQSQGTHWYHPHKHGSVATQVTNGMSGAFIVEGGGLDSLQAAYNMRDVLVAVQEIDTEPNLMGPAIARAKLVNGDYAPTIVMRPGEVLRMRLVNENVSATATYKILFDTTGAAGPKLYDVARDGVSYAPGNYDTLAPDTSLYVAPGNRLDMFVRAPGTPGTHDLRAVVTKAAQQRSRKLRANAPVATTQTLFRVRVVDDGSTYNTTLPPALPPLPSYLANLDSTVNTPTTTLVFTETGGPGGGATPPSFFLGTIENPNQQFSSNYMFMEMPLGATQMWQINNTSPNNINHPFHIHINPFQVVSVTANPADPNYDYYQFLNRASQNGNPVWMDVFPLPIPLADGSAGSARIRQKYTEFTGPFVMHCHILGHEERGMMQKIAITGPGQGGGVAANASPRPAGGVAGRVSSPGAGSGARGGGGGGDGGGHGAHGAGTQRH
jgi:FtsP/CotA-like multicopper oxidase with cupredoxin domain